MEKENKVLKDRLETIESKKIEKELESQDFQKKFEEISG